MDINLCIDGSPCIELGYIGETVGFCHYEHDCIWKIPIEVKT